jgi:hypothetical protein
MKTILTIGITILAAAALAQTSISPVNIGASPNDGTGDPLRTSFTKLNANDASLNLNKLETNNPTGSGTFTMIRGTTAQRFDLYNTFIDSSNYKRLSMYFSGGDYILDANALGTPLSGGDFRLAAPGFHSIRLSFGGIDFSHSYYNFDTNRFAPLSLWDGLLDLGGSDRRWKNVYGVNFNGSQFTGTMFMNQDSTFMNWLNFTNPATGPANAFHVDGQVVVTGGPGEVDVQFTSGRANGSAATVTVSADNLSAGNDVSAGNNVNAGNSVTAGNTVTAGNSVSVASGSSSLGPLTLTLAGATISQQTQTATSPTRAWRQLNFGFFVSPSGPTNNFFQFDAETLFKGAGDYAGYEWLHQDGSVSFDKSGTTNNFVGTFNGTVNSSTNTAATKYFATTDSSTSWGTGTLYTNGPQGSVFRMDISSTSGGSGSPNQVFFHYTNGLPSSPIGRQRQAFFTLSSGAVNVQSMTVELDPGATFKIDTITSTGGSFNFLNQTISSR